MLILHQRKSHYSCWLGLLFQHVWSAATLPLYMMIWMKHLETKPKVTITGKALESAEGTTTTPIAIQDIHLGHSTKIKLTNRSWWESMILREWIPLRKINELRLLRKGLDRIWLRRKIVGLKFDLNLMKKKDKFCMK